MAPIAGAGPTATFFYMTDQRGTDRTSAKVVTAPPASTSSSASSSWRYVR